MPVVGFCRVHIGVVPPHYFTSPHVVHSILAKVARQCKGPLVSMDPFFPRPMKAPEIAKLPRRLQIEKNFQRCAKPRLERHVIDKIRGAHFCHGLLIFCRNGKGFVAIVGAAQKHHVPLNSYVVKNSAPRQLPEVLFATRKRCLQEKKPHSNNA